MSIPQRRDRRVRAVLPVRLSAPDLSLRLNAIPAFTLDVAARGARLGGIQFFGDPGTLITIERGTGRATFKVVWVGTTGSPVAYQIGLESVDAVRGLWGMELPMGNPDLAYIPAAVAKPVTSSPRPSSSRHSAVPASATSSDPSLIRFACEGVVEIRRDVQRAKPFHGKLRDIGPRGLFILSGEKIPAGAHVNLLVLTEHDSLTIRGIVRTTEALGMYIEFMEMKETQANALYAFIVKIAN